MTETAGEAQGRGLLVLGDAGGSQGRRPSGLGLLDGQRGRVFQAQEQPRQRPQHEKEPGVFSIQREALCRQYVDWWLER